MEVLAPAGDSAALEAALDSGADAVYFGLTGLNARRRAQNFRQEEFGRAVERVHTHGAKAYLTLNIDLTERDLGQAARILELARQSKVDAVLVRDPAVFALAAAYPELVLHLSTQTCMTSSADVAAARELGAKRVVLARELTLAEVAACSAVRGIETEVFVQGALCFSVSGRCLLSSWVGGRSGNRGACTSPCRVPWTVDEQPAGTPLSMHDLSLVERLADLQEAGVRGLKIEGRLKSADWVRRAVDLYRRAMAGEDAKNLRAEAEQLGAYTGRRLTSGYLDGDRANLTGISGRMASCQETSAPASDDANGGDERPEILNEGQPVGTDAGDSNDHPVLSVRRSELDAREEIAFDEDAISQEAESDGLSAEEAPDEDDGPTYDFSMTVGPKGVQCQVVCGSRATEWTIPKTVVRRPHKAVNIGQLLAWLQTQTVQGCRLVRSSTNEPDFLLVPRAVNALMDRISAANRLGRKAPDNQVRIELTAAAAEILVKQSPSTANRLKLGDKPDRVRLEAGQVQAFLQETRPDGVIVESLSPQGLERIRSATGQARLIVALPQVFFEEEIPAIKELVRKCAKAGLTVEVNSWGGWLLARQARVGMESGPGLPVLNALAARRLRKAGVECVTLSPEAQRRQLEEVSAVCPVPCSLVVFGRPPLLATRVQFSRSRLRGRTLTDRRGVRLVPRVERGLWVFRPEEPMDLRATVNDHIRVQHLVMDLVGSDDPLGDWLAAPVDNKRTFRFNYDRSLA